mgnify:CR=1
INKFLQINKFPQINKSQRINNNAQTDGCLSSQLHPLKLQHDVI